MMTPIIPMGDFGLTLSAKLEGLPRRPVLFEGLLQYDTEEILLSQDCPTNIDGQ